MEKIRKTWIFLIGIGCALVAISFISSSILKNLEESLGHQIYELREESGSYMFVDKKGSELRVSRKDFIQARSLSLGAIISGFVGSILIVTFIAIILIKGAVSNITRR